MKNQIRRIPTNKSFTWNRGLCLRATSTCSIVLPGNVVLDNEAIGAILETSDDDARIGFQEAADGSGAFERIVVQLQSGMSLRLHRASEALVIQENDPAIFEVVSQAESDD